MKKFVFILMVVLFLESCTTLPTGPSSRAVVYPSAGKTTDMYQQDVFACRMWSAEQIGVNPGQIMNDTTISSAVVGTLLGAGMGAAIGSAYGGVGIGTAYGASIGLLYGGIVGSTKGSALGQESQARYDSAYQQCMVTKGNIVGTVQVVYPSSCPTRCRPDSPYRNLPGCPVRCL